MNKAAISNQMQIECSPVRYQPGQPPQVVIMAMLKEPSLTCPTVNKKCKVISKPFFLQDIVYKVHQVSKDEKIV